MPSREARARRAQGGDLWLIHVKPQVEEALDGGGFLDEIGRDHLFRSRGEAVSAVYRHLDRSVCSNCKHHVFLECRQAAGDLPAAATRSAHLLIPSGETTP